MTSRIELLDVARGSLMLLVVWGHLLESKGFDGSLYFSIYTFHIPAFAMISGMLANSRLDAKGIVRIGKQLLVPLIIFQILYFLALQYLAPNRVAAIHTPAWIIWFLFSLLAWKILLPLVTKLPYPIILSVVAALAAGFFDKIEADFSLSRSFVFFPAFLFGHIYGNSVLEVVSRFRIGLCALFVTIFFVAFWVSDQVDIRWLWGSDPYSILPSVAPGIVYRAAAIAIGLAMSVAFLAVVPPRSKALAFLGQKTMPVYLWHGFFVMLFWASGFQVSSEFGFLLLTAALAMAIAFSIAWIRNSVPRSLTAQV